MSTAYVYILYSNTLRKHYIGATQFTAHERLEQHLAQHYPAQFTASATDWKLVFSIPCEHYSQALAIERHIKRMKSRVYISNLLTYPDITEQLLQKYA